MFPAAFVLLLGAKIRVDSDRRQWQLWKLCAQRWGLMDLDRHQWGK